MSQNFEQASGEEYVTTDELAGRIKMAPGTIRNLVWKQQLKKNIHYLKPTPRKLLFVWSRVEEWLHQETPSGRIHERPNSRSLINI